jgi:mannan endo-1,4-beta-mannosidase
MSRTNLARAAAIAMSVVALAAACSDDATPTRARRTTTTANATRHPVTTQPPTTATGAPHGNGRFTIVGHDIVDPDGNLFVPIGANMAVRQGGYEEGYAFNWNGTGTGHVADVKAWGWNTVRATLICAPEGSPTPDELDRGIDDFVDEYTSQRVVVIVECHDITIDDLAPSDPRVAQLLAFWERFAAKYKDNTYVWFNPYNEPQGGAEPADVANWLALQRDALVRLRAIAPTNVFVADIPGGGQAVQAFTGERPITELGSGQCNVLYSWHAYGALGSDGVFGKFEDYGHEKASRANHDEAFAYLRDHGIPVIIGEVGDPLTLDEGTAGQPIWNRIASKAVIADAASYGIGMLWWHATGDSGAFLTYTLMADRHQPPWSAAATGAGLSDGGRRFWEASKHQPQLGPFTGDLAASNCG